MARMRIGISSRWTFGPDGGVSFKESPPDLMRFLEPEGRLKPAARWLPSIHGRTNCGSPSWIRIMLPLASTGSSASYFEVTLSIRPEVRCEVHSEALASLRITRCPPRRPALGRIGTRLDGSEGRSL